MQNLSPFFIFLFSIPTKESKYQGKTGKTCFHPKNKKTGPHMFDEKKKYLHINLNKLSFIYV